MKTKPTRTADAPKSTNDGAPSKFRKSDDARRTSHSASSYHRITAPLSSHNDHRRRIASSSTVARGRRSIQPARRFPFRKRLRDNGHEETTVVSDSKPSLVSQKPREVEEIAPPSKKARRGPGAKISLSDVHTVLQRVHDQRAPPSHLNLHVVPAGRGDSSLSPPSYEFEHGLYILMAPGQRVPCHLAEYVAEGKLPPSCPWSVGDPLVARPTAIQQRVCVPKGNLKYSSHVGGVLFTIYALSGKESLEYRLLLVYSSAEGVDGGTVPNTFATPNRHPSSNSVASSMSESFDETPATTNGTFSPDGMDSRPSSALTLPLFDSSWGLDPNADADIASVFAEPEPTAPTNSTRNAVAEPTEAAAPIPEAAAAATGQLARNDGWAPSQPDANDGHDDAPAGHPSLPCLIQFGAPGRHENAQGRTATHDIDGVIARVQASSAERSYQAERSLNMVRTGIVSKRPAVGASRPATARLDPFNAPRPKREIIKKPSFPWKRR